MQNVNQLGKTLSLGLGSRQGTWKSYKAILLSQGNVSYSEKEKGNDYYELSAGDIQYELNLKRAAGLVCEAMDKVKNDQDIIIYKPNKKALSYKIKFDLRNR